MELEFTNALPKIFNINFPGAHLLSYHSALACDTDFYSNCFSISDE